MVDGGSGNAIMSCSRGRSWIDCFFNCSDYNNTIRDKGLLSKEEIISEWTNPINSSNDICLCCLRNS